MDATPRNWMHYAEGSTDPTQSRWWSQPRPRFLVVVWLQGNRNMVLPLPFYCRFFLARYTRYRRYTRLTSSSSSVPKGSPGVAGIGLTNHMTELTRQSSPFRFTHDRPRPRQLLYFRHPHAPESSHRTIHVALLANSPSRRATDNLLCTRRRPQIHCAQLPDLGAPIGRYSLNPEHRHSSPLVERLNP